MPFLERIDAGGTVLEAVQLGDKPAFLGRLDGCAITITDDAQISRKHCAVAFADGRWVLHDLKSRNGTFVGTHRIEAVKLRDGGVFRLGSALVRFVQERTAPVGAAPRGGGDEDVYDVAVLVDDDEDAVATPPPDADPLAGPAPGAAAPGAGVPVPGVPVPGVPGGGRSRATRTGPTRSSRWRPSATTRASGSTR